MVPALKRSPASPFRGDSREDSGMHIVVCIKQVPDSAQIRDPSGHQHHHAPGRAGDHQSVRPVLAGRGAAAEGPVRRPCHGPDHGAADGGSVAAEGAVVRRHRRRPADRPQVRRFGHPRDLLRADLGDPQVARGGAGGHGVLRQADDRRRHRAGRSRHRDPHEHAAVDLCREDRGREPGEPRDHGSPPRPKAACRC